MAKKQPISRRDFIKGMAAGAASVVTLGVLQACEAGLSGSADSSAASSGSTAATVAAGIAAEEGVSVALLQKEASVVSQGNCASAIWRKALLTFLPNCECAVLPSQGETLQKCPGRFAQGHFHFILVL